jgi:hypothetical protein
MAFLGVNLADVLLQLPHAHDWCVALDSFDALDSRPKCNSAGEQHIPSMHGECQGRERAVAPTRR